MTLFPNKPLSVTIAALSLILLNACSSSGDVKGRDFEVSSVVKNDIDLVSETHQQIVLASLRELAVKLYKRNPAEWKKEGHRSLQDAVDALASEPFPLIEGKTSIDCIRLAFDEVYQGDRVRAFVVGLETMVLNSYDGHREFYLHNMLEAQKLYDSARNLELASWLLRSKHNSEGELFLLSSGDAEEVNLSFERLFGKMINAQDMLAQIMADRTHRQIKNVIQALATAFIPI
ncbi:hypothetical protein Q9L42_004920 [Methylomarinum sp. Ch1-1]|uniref:Lipoprotein n=1 Tax=Methylomarinum roseum TaxID=3067653 RepID=A0AAU7NWY6_9GAMM|nr:hypothetical protein [Methylomarinum sp. Ch1-1]MDP4522461.1 hypothetical protein [Methylomarinum sp. Ch1-1]